MQSARKKAGFTLIELVAAIVLISIVALFVFPKFSSRSGFTEYAVRDELKAALRYAQQRAMYDHDPAGGGCYSVVWNSAGFAPMRDGASIARYANGNTVSLSGDYAGVALIPPSGAVYFDTLGSPRSGSCTGAAMSTDIQIADAVTLILRVYSTGYVQSL